MPRGPDEDRPGVVDRIVQLVAGAMDAVGLNGTRLRWKWNQRRSRLTESGMRAEILWRSARGRHKMCPACRALVPRAASRCGECGETLASVRAPGIGRLVANVLPGATAATSLILLANGFWFLMMLMAHMRSGEGGSLLGSFGGELLFRFGSGFSPYTLAGEWWRIVTPIFLHGGILHFFFNSYVLLQLGPVVEEELGTERFWVLYLLCGIAGSAASQLARPVNTVGASGALLGMMGLLLAYGWRTGGARGEALRQSMLRYGMYILIFSLLMHNIVDHVNHAGGFVCGALAGLVVRGGGFRTRAGAVAWETAAIGGVLLVLVSFYKVAVSAIP